jgi:hypothetical protein
MEPNGELRREIARLEEEAAAAKRRLEAKKAELDRIERACHHDWGAAVEGHRVGRESVIDWARPPETHGVHIDYHTTTVEKRVPTWSRTCKRCGRTEITERTKDVVSKAPDF